MTKYTKLLNIVNEAIRDNEEAIEAFEELTDIIKQQGFEEGWQAAEDEEEALDAQAEDLDDDIGKYSDD